MSRCPDLFIGRVFVSDERMETALAGFQEVKLWANLEDGHNAAFRGGGLGGFIVEGKNLLIMGDDRAFGQLGQVLTNLDLARYNSELFCEETHEPGNMDLPSPLSFQ